MQFPGSTYTEIHTSNISASAQKTPAAASNKHIRTLLPLSQLRWQMQTSARTSTFSGPLMIYLGKTECYLLGEMRLVLGEKWYGRCCEASVRQMKIFWCLKHPAGKPTVCAYLHNSHTNIGPFSDQTNANINIQGSGGSQATSESASEAQSPQMQSRKQNRRSRVLLCTKGGTFIWLLEKKSGHKVLGNRWYFDVQPLCFCICITLIRHAQENIRIS